MRTKWAALLLTLVVGFTTACAGGAVTPSAGDSAAAPVPTGPGRTVTFLSHVEPLSMSDHRAITSTGSAPTDAIRMFNASLYLADDRGVFQPYLTERKPELNTDTWRVFPDGRMETVYTLRSGITWHDGVPFTAEDMVFSWRVAKTPEFGVSELLPTRLMDDVVAVDERTILVRWSRVLPRAESPSGRDWAPLPRHLLERDFEAQRADAFASHPYWTRDYVGLGPFKLDRREPGAFVEGSAFDAHILGRPKIDRIKIQFVADPNTAVANLLAGEAHMAIDFTLGFEQGALLKREWSARQGGSVLLSPDKLRYVQIQFRPEYGNPLLMSDVRVRKALLHAVDKRGLLDALLDGEGQGAEGMAPPLVDYADQVDRAIAKYSYDLQAAERLLADAGLTRTSGGLVAAANGERFAPELRATAGGQEEREAAILADGWRRIGVDTPMRLLSAVEDRDREIRAVFPGMGTANTGLDDDTLYLKLYTANIPTAASRWAGSNRGGWSNPSYDRFYDVMTSNLDRSERVQAIVGMSRLVSEEVPILPMYYNLLVLAHVSDLSGPKAYAPGGEATWNAHLWEMKR